MHNLVHSEKKHKKYHDRLFFSGYKFLGFIHYGLDVIEEKQTVYHIFRTRAKQENDSSLMMLFNM